MPTPMSRWVLPVPESPRSTRGWPRSIQLPAASAARVAGGTPGAAAWSKSLRRLTRGKWASLIGRSRRRGSRVAVSALGSSSMYARRGARQAAAVGSLVAGGGVGELAGECADRGQVQRTAGDADRGVRGGLGQRADARRGLDAGGGHGPGPVGTRGGR